MTHYTNAQYSKDHLGDKVSSINYGNFKSSIDKSEHRRHDAYLKVWSELRVLQD